MSTDELDFIKVSIEEIKALINKILDREESRSSRINDLERGQAVLTIECNNCRTNMKKDMDSLYTKVRSLEEAPENGIKKTNEIISLLLSAAALVGIIAGAVIAFYKVGILKG